MKKVGHQVYLSNLQDLYKVDRNQQKKPQTQNLPPLLKITEQGLRRGEKPFIPPQSFDLLRAVLKDPAYTDSAKESAKYIIATAHENKHALPNDLLADYVKPPLNKPGNIPAVAKKSIVNSEFLGIVARGFNDNQVGVSEFSEYLTTQLQEVLSNANSALGDKNNALFILNEASKHVGEVGLEKLKIPANLAKYVAVNIDDQKIDDPVPIQPPQLKQHIDKYQILDTLASKFREGINIPLTAKTINLLTEALKDPLAPQAKQNAANIILAAYGKPGQNLITIELLVSAQDD